MKQNKMFSVLTGIALVFSSASALAGTPGVAGELGLHKLERLVTLKKIDASFETQASSLSVSAAGAGYNVMVMEGAAADGSMRMLMMTADKDGRILTYKESGKKDPASPIKLPGKNAVNLMELGMHCVEGELIAGDRTCADFANGKLYNEHFSSADLEVTKNAGGAITGAVVTIQGDGLAKKLVVALANDGTLVSLTEK